MLNTAQMSRRREQPAEVTPFLLNSGLNEARRDSRSSLSSSKRKTTAKLEKKTWEEKTKERQLVRERGTLLKEVRELHHTTNLFTKAKREEAKEHFADLQSKIGILSKLHHGSYQLNKRNTLSRIDSNRKSLQSFREEGRKYEMSRTTTEEQYQSVLNSMDQVMVEAEDLGRQFEKQLREKARQHHELGIQLREIGAQLRIERAKKKKFAKEEERRKKVEAVEKLAQWRDSEVMDKQLKTQLASYEKEYLDNSRVQGRESRDVEHSVKLKEREYGRKLQDVHCLLEEVAEEQRKLGENKSRLQDQITLQDNEQNVQNHTMRQTTLMDQKQAKTNKWEPKLQALARENEARLDKMEKQVLYENVVKAGGQERNLFRQMRSLESDARKQEQVCTSKRAALEAAETAARKRTQDDLRAANNTYVEMREEVDREEALLRKLVVKRDSALTQYREHQTGLKDIIQLFQTISSEQERRDNVTGQAVESG